MTAPRPIEPNFSDSVGAKTSQAQASVGKFDSVLSGLSYGAAIAGPAAYAATAQYAPKSADIVGAAVNATSGYGGMGMGASGVYFGGGNPAALTTASGSVSFGGSGMKALDNPASDPNAMINQAQQQLASTQASSVAMMMIQDQQSNQNRLFTTASNLMSARDSMISNIMRNVRGQ